MAILKFTLENAAGEALANTSLTFKMLDSRLGEHIVASSGALIAPVEVSISTDAMGKVEVDLAPTPDGFIYEMSLGLGDRRVLRHFELKQDANLEDLAQVNPTMGAETLPPTHLRSVDPSELLKTNYFSLTAAQLQASSTTPVELFPAPGPNKLYWPLAAFMLLQGTRPPDPGGNSWEDTNQFFIEWETNSFFARFQIDSVIANSFHSTPYWTSIWNRNWWGAILPNRPVSFKSGSPITTDTTLKLTVLSHVIDLEEPTNG